MLEYFTRENITMALAIFGSLGTIFCAIYYLVTHKVKVKINVTGYRLTNTSLLLYVTFTSKSARPSLTSLSNTQIKVSMRLKIQSLCIARRSNRMIN